MSGATGKRVSLRWQLLRVAEVRARVDGCELDARHVRALQASFARLGGQLQLQPIVVDNELTLIDGAHRLEAARRARWDYIAAVVVSDSRGVDRALLEAEANRIRRSLGVLELEEVWRTHYEPELRKAAHERKLAALRRHTRAASQVRGGSVDQRPGPATSVIGNSNNGDGAGGVGSGNVGHAGIAGISGYAENDPPAESLPRAARRITGLSLSTLNKVAQIRVLASAAEAPVALRDAAEAALTRLATRRVSVESVYRALRNLQERTDRGAARDKDEPGADFVHADELSLERVLAESSWLAERLDGPLSEQLSAAAHRSDTNRDMLRGIRFSLEHSLAAVAAIDHRLEAA